MIIYGLTAFWKMFNLSTIFWRPIFLKFECYNSANFSLEKINGWKFIWILNNNPNLHSLWLSAKLEKCSLSHLPARSVGIHNIMFVLLYCRIQNLFQSRPFWKYQVGVDFSLTITSSLHIIFVYPTWATCLSSTASIRMFCLLLHYRLTSLCWCILLRV